MMALLTGVLLSMPPLKPAEIERVRKLAVAACVQVGDREHTRQGSGVVVARRGIFLYILTAAHVVDGVKEMVVLAPAKPPADHRRLGEVELLLMCLEQDFALVRVASGTAEVTPLPLAGEAPEADGAFDAVSAGYGGDGPESRPERVLGKKLLRRSGAVETFTWECRDRSEKGRSGGPLLDLRGRVIGICRGTQDGKGYYCHLDEILAALKKHNYAWLWREP